MPTGDSYYDLALAITRKYNVDLRDANKLGEVPTIIEEHAMSAGIKREREIASMSMNDILDAHSAEFLLRDPVLREKLLKCATTLNSIGNRF